jgi:hypothetical protein
MGAIAQDELRTGSLAAQDDVVELSQPGTATVLAQLTGTFTATVVFELNVDQGSSPTWVATNFSNVNTGATASSATATGIYRIDMSGAREMRARCSAFTSGPVVVTLNGSVATARPAMTSSGAVVDTELAAAAALADATANPTTASAGAFVHGFNGTTWDRARTANGASGAAVASTPVLAITPVLNDASTLWQIPRTASAIGDAVAGGAMGATGNWIWNGSSWDRQKGTNTGQAQATLYNTAGTAIASSNPNSDTQGSTTGLATTGYQLAYDGTNWNRVRTSVEASYLTSIARTATPTVSDVTTYNANGITVVINVTAITASPSVVFTIDGKDALSGVYYNLLTSAAIVGTGTTVLRVALGATVAANLVVSLPLPRVIRILPTHGDADSITYTVGYVLHV